MTDTDVMTVREVADYLKLKERTIYRSAANRAIPAFKVGGSLRFRKGGIDRRTESNMVGPGHSGKRVAWEK